MIMPKTYEQLKEEYPICRATFCKYIAELREEIRAGRYDPCIRQYSKERRAMMETWQSAKRLQFMESGKRRLRLHRNLRGNPNPV